VTTQSTTTDSVHIGQAPGDLATLQAFVNTLDIEQGTDELGSPAALDDWLAAAGLPGYRDGAPGPPASPADLAAGIDLREALRAVLRSHVTQPAEAGRHDAAGRLGAIASRLPARLEVRADGQVAAGPAGSGPLAGLTSLLLIAAEAATLGTWPRLKVCSADDCQWAFYDRSPTRSGCWCSMRVCGGRAKSRAYRRRAANAR
jgi:predicted RNA-binding Zn ribbon-like protein